MSTTPGDILFIDSYSPSLNVGEYEIKIQQKLSGSIEDIKTQTQKIFVSGPQFFLDPKDIHTHYPAHDAYNNFSTNLPYIVFTKRLLPWERIIGKERTLGETSPWMALLVFTEEEVSPTLTMSIKDYLNPVRKHEGKEIKSIVPLKRADKFTDLEKSCECIEISINTFQKIVPHYKEVSYLAHCRKVAMDHKVDIDMTHSGDFSVILANRMPVKQVKNIVHLVSLEKCEKYLKGKFTEAEKKLNQLRLISLANWSFQCTEGKDSFEEIVKNLLKEEKKQLLRLPIDGTKLQIETKKRFQKGYVPLPFQLMDGKSSFAWYRGPLIPTTGQKVVKQLLFSASSAMLFDQKTGIFDLSYSTAWQLGRSLALADPHFAIHLKTLRQKIHYKLDQSFDQFATKVKATKASFSNKKINVVMQDVVNINIIDSQMTNFNSDLGKSIFKGFENEVKEKNDPEAVFEEANVGGTSEDLGFFLDCIEKGRAGNDSNQESGIQAASSKINYKKFIQSILILFQEEIKEIADWLDQLNIENIPFYHNIPHPALLPKESLRFFQIDKNWWHALYNGALSLSIHTRIDKVIFQLLAQNIIGPEHQTILKNDSWGLLLRSKLVKVWSGLELPASKAGAVIAPILKKRMQEDLLLFLFAEKPDRLELKMPKEGLQMGGHTDKNDIKISIKNIDDNNAGKLITGKEATLVFRNNSLVIDLKKSIEAIREKLPKGQKEMLKGAGFALQLLKKPKTFVFK